VPILLVFILATVDFARVNYAYSVISDAAREGARYAIVHGSLAESLDGLCGSGPGAACDASGAKVIAAAKSLTIGIDTSQVTVAACWGNQCTIASDCSSAANTTTSNVPETPVEVRVCYPFQPVTAAFLPLIGNSVHFGTIQLAASATLTIAH